MALREILAHFGFDVDDKKLEGLDHRIGEITEKLKGFGEVIAASFIGERMHAFLESQIQIGAELEVMSERLGVTTEELQRFQLAAQLSGMSAEEANTSLRFFNRTMGQAASGGGDMAAEFAKMHIDVKALADDSTPLVDKVGRLAEGFAELKTHGEKVAFAMKVFGRGGAAMVPVLSEGREKVEELFDEFDTLGGGMSKEFTESSHKAEHASKKLQFALQSLKSRVATELIPSFTHITERVTKWVVWAIKLSKTTNVLKTALVSLKLGAFVAIIAKVYKMMGLAEGGAWGFIKSLLKLGPIVLFALALYLVFDSLYTLWEGGDSVIGDLIDQLLGVGTSKQVVEDLHEAWDKLVKFWGSDGSDTVKTLARYIVGTLVAACDMLILAGEEIGETFMFAWHAVGGKLTDADKDLKDMKKHIDDVDSHMSKLGAWVGGAGAAPVIPATGGAGGPATGRQALKIEINNQISGVSDPKAAGEHAGRMTKDALNGKGMRDAFASVPR